DEDPGARLKVLEVMKANRGPTGERVVVEWKNGVFVPVGGASTIEQAAREQAVEEAFLKGLKRITDQGLAVGPNSGSNYAPSRIAEQAEAKGIRKRDLADAMKRLLNSNKIHVAVEGPPSRRTLILHPWPKP